jgi:shikimate kinase/3-dehydroquinate synthase
VDARPTHALDRHIALSGFMGAGKTTLGCELAGALGRPFVDVDSEIEQIAQAPIAEIFQARGESEFRRLEERCIRDALGRFERAVIALGGGALTSEATRVLLRERALTLFVEVNVDDAWQRIGSGSERPLARDEASFRALFAERLPVYESCADAAVEDLESAILAAGGVVVSSGSIERLGTLVPGDARVALVIDRTVAGIYGDTVVKALGSRLIGVHELPPGEEAKSFANFKRLLEELALERGDLLVGLGGGCTTDVAGFAAATYMRGIDWVAVPTSLVGQIDAGIGGKTAIDLKSGKNLAGAFHWPARVVIDTSVLGTLPPEQRREGMAEVVKTGLLAGRELWELPDEELVRGCALYKVGVCLRDSRERGERAVLNLGHTFAHALEAGGDFGRPTHGEAVALGLLAALRLSVERGLDPKWVRVVEEVLSPRPVVVERERAWKALFRDKKVAAGSPKFVLLDAFGKPVRSISLTKDDARAALDALIVDS